MSDSKIDTLSRSAGSSVESELSIPSSSLLRIIGVFVVIDEVLVVVDLSDVRRMSVLAVEPALLTLLKSMCTCSF